MTNVSLLSRVTPIFVYGFSADAEPPREVVPEDFAAADAVREQQLSDQYSSWPTAIPELLMTRIGGIGVPGL